MFPLSTVLGRGTRRAWEGTVNFPVHVQTLRSRGLALSYLARGRASFRTLPRDIKTSAILSGLTYLGLTMWAFIA